MLSIPASTMAASAYSPRIPVQQSSFQPLSSVHFNLNGSYTRDSLRPFQTFQYSPISWSSSLHRFTLACANTIPITQSKEDSEKPEDFKLKPELLFLNRKSFPEDFFFGVGSAAFQVEGATDIDGREKSIWDTYCDNKSVEDAENKDGWLSYKHGSDHYRQFETDVRLVKDLGVNSYRFSISWSRLVPKGRVGDNKEGVNPKGVAFYNNLINALKARGIEPFVTLFHWDLPQELENYGGFLNLQEIRKDFKNYADFCFQEFGDRVKHWTTVNEPSMFAKRGYQTGESAPGHKNEAEKYIVAHHQLLAHADVYNLYKEKYKPTQKGEVGISLESFWYEPATNTEEDKKASEEKLDFSLGWFMEPLTSADYPRVLKEYLKTLKYDGKLLSDQLKFESDDSKLLLNSFDFIGLNYYTALKAKSKVSFAGFHGKQTFSKWIYLHEEGLQKILKKMNSYRDQIAFYVTENGLGRPSDKSPERLPYDIAKQHDWRVRYHHAHLRHLLRVIKENDVKVKGYFAWSFLDSFEWGKDIDHFGFYYVDHSNDKFERKKTDAVDWFKSFLKE